MMTTFKTWQIAICAVFFSGVVYAQESLEKTENRCGWFLNPTPGNVWFQDRDGEWTISTQGNRDEAEGDWPDFNKDTYHPHQWVITNTGSYGHGCACLKLIVDHQTYKVLRIVSSQVRPLAACRKDRHLKEPE